MTRHARPDGGQRHLLKMLAVGVGATALATLGALVLDGGRTPAAGPPVAAATPAAEVARRPEPDAVFTVVATGDVLPHLPVHVSARAEVGGYDFSDLLAGTDAWVRGADLALCHLEVPLTAPGVRPTGYPLFAADAHLATDLREQGWDGCSTASNHSVDQGRAGVTATLDALDAAGLGHVGTARSAAEAAAPALYTLERAGRSIVVAHLAGTYGTNGVPIPASAPWSVTLLDGADLVERARAAREAGADLVIVSMHSGVEYSTPPTDEQVGLATLLAASGQVDLVLGHHAHVPQPTALLPGGPDGQGMWVAYGLGNYVSNQDGDCCDARTDSGLLVTATITQPAGAPARVTGFEWTAVTVDRLGKHAVLALADLAGDGTSTLSPAALTARYDRVRTAVGDAAPERVSPPVATGPPPTVGARTAGVAAAVGTVAARTGASG
ncbi:CapA family protein [Oerskovia sp. NPDC056781]|uniref:CapA family protein n=1 Tax=Oerskovia sp. NPDC056781 TaxID=3345942 RepID=UPI00366E1953